MITRFSGKNFGVLEEFSVDLEPLTLLVGPNASGKTTFLRGLRFLAMLTRNPIYGQSGAIRLGYRASIEDYLPMSAPDRRITLGIEVKNEGGSGQYELTMGRKEPDFRIKVLDEKVSWQPTKGESFVYDSTTPPFNFEYRGARVSSELPRESTLAFLCGPYRNWPNWTHKLRPIFTLMDGFAPFHAFRFSPAEIARPVPPGQEVHFNGAGLAAELDRLAGEDRTEFDRIEKGLGKIFNHIKQIKVPTIKTPHQVLKGLVFVGANGEEVPAELESDGVLLTLAYLWLATRKDVAFGIEEPETATYPSLIQSRLAHLRDLSEGKFGGRPVQVIATTHSSLLLTAAQNPKLVKVFERKGNGLSLIYQPKEEFMQELIYNRLGWAVGPD